MSMKVCFKCQEEKPLDEFYRHSKMADGHLGKCKTCTKKDVRENYAQNREYYSRYDAKRYKRRRDSGYMAEAQRRHRAKNPARTSCRYKFAYALKKGKLVKPDACEKCGASDIEIQGHHADYSKPYEVTWLCLKCHRAQHGQTVVTKNDRYL